MVVRKELFLYTDVTVCHTMSCLYYIYNVHECGMIHRGSDVVCNVTHKQPVYHNVTKL